MEIYATFLKVTDWNSAFLRNFPIIPKEEYRETSQDYKLKDIQLLTHLLISFCHEKGIKNITDL